MIRIKSKQKNFRRCGIPHDDQWVKYPNGRFTPAELSILKAEPMLIVEVVPEKAAPADAPKKPESPQADATVKADESGKEPVKASKKGRK